MRLASAFSGRGSAVGLACCTGSFSSDARSCHTFVGQCRRSELSVCVGPVLFGVPRGRGGLRASQSSSAWCERPTTQRCVALREASECDDGGEACFPCRVVERHRGGSGCPPAGGRLPSLNGTVGVHGSRLPGGPSPSSCVGYLVDPASSHMLVSKTKPCMSKYERFYTVKLRMAH